MNNRWMQGVFCQMTLFSATPNNISMLLALEHKFLGFFSSTCFLQLSRFQYVCFSDVSLASFPYVLSSLAANMSLFFFQINLINFVSYFVIYARRTSIVKNFGLMRNKICHYIKNIFIKKQY